MDRELNLPLTARESALVKVAITRLRDEENRFIWGIKNGVTVYEVPGYEQDVKDMNSILDKIERMADG